MCVDLDEDNRIKAKINMSFGFGYDAATAINNPGAAFVTVDEVVVTAQNPQVIVEIKPRVTTPIGNVVLNNMHSMVLTDLPLLDNLEMPSDPTPCVTSTPSGTNLQSLNSQAKYLGIITWGKHSMTGWEYGGIIYRNADGSLHQFPPFTSGSAGGIANVSVPLPAGSVIVGWGHTHPVTPGTDQRWLSAADRAGANAYVALGPSRVDPNLLIYITTFNPVTNQIETYVYDKNNRNTEAPSCKL
ncbi:MAG: hypothetical protein Q8Q88_20245 [Phenylobacterium sp.]|uniref:hypothetical protein n=1 Tax=Phenylobacterium sp. TaxID=1871053 RepID=UPI00273767BA|nr:hypothetical protein [Phenylobacterium sp.]MDP3749374.1 hypothetical protein [Phenylobacterium sp.]